MPARVTRLGEFTTICFRQHFENYREGQFLATFFLGKSYVLVWTKMGWATLWAIFHKLVVTLAPAKCCI
jgi:hypothetical protein